MLGAEGDCDLFRGVIFSFAAGVEPPGAAEGFEPGEGDPLTTSATDTGGEEFSAPFVLPKGFAGASSGVVGREDCGSVSSERFDGGCGDGLDGEGAGDADFCFVGLRLVVEGLLGSVLLDARVDLGLPLLPDRKELFMGLLCRFRPGGVGIEGDVPLFAGGLRGGVDVSEGGLDLQPVLLVDVVDRGVVRDGFEGDVRDSLIDKPAPDALLGVGEVVVVEDGGHEPLFGKGDGDAGGVAGDPAPAPLLGDIGGGPGAAGGVKDEVAGVGGHEEAAFDDFG